MLVPKAECLHGDADVSRAQSTIALQFSHSSRLSAEPMGLPNDGCSNIVMLHMVTSTHWLDRSALATVMQADTAIPHGQSCTVIRTAGLDGVRTLAATLLRPEYTHSQDRSVCQVSS